MEATLDPPAAPAAELPGVGAVLSAGTRAAGENLGLLLGIWAATGLPAQILGIAASAATGIVDGDALQKAVDAGDWSVVGPFAAVAVVGMALGLLGYAATILVAARAHEGRESGLGGTLADAAGRLFAVVLTCLLTAAAVLAGSLLLVLPGVYALVRLSLAVCASVIEETGARASAARSWELTRGRVWTLLGFFAAFVGLAFAAAVALVSAGELLDWIASPAGPEATAVVRIALNAGQFMVSAWVTACLVALYRGLDALAPRPVETIAPD